MHPQELKQLLESRIPNCEFIVNSDDGHHFQTIAIGEVFATLPSPVKRQRLVLGALSEEFASQKLHAMELKTYTPAQWDKVKDLQAF